MFGMDFSKENLRLQQLEALITRVKFVFAVKYRTGYVKIFDLVCRLWSNDL
jgi:hypothetical protein